MSLLVAITGGSGSGKTTLALALAGALPTGSAGVVSEDWYYRDLAADPGFDPSAVDFDDVSIRDHELLLEHLSQLKAGARVLAPRYCFHRHAREAEPVLQSPTPVLIVEGSHLLCADRLAAIFDVRIFVDAPADIRLLRRFIRDQTERGRSPASIIEQYLRTVRPAYERLTGPSRARADLVISDETLRVQAPTLEESLELLSPVLAHPRLSAYRGSTP
jgi:uridine kinase